MFLIDKDTDELVAMVFDGITADDKEVRSKVLVLLMLSNHFFSLVLL